MELEQKRLSCELKSAAIEGNRIRGTAAVMGNIDRGDDCIFPGAFKNCLQQLLTSGFVAANHDWSWEGMKAMPKVAQEKGSRLYTEAVFHSTPDAQEIRTKCMERIANNLSVGFSIGFGIDPESCKHFRSGPAMLDYARSAGCDMTLFDTQGIMNHKRPVRAILDIPELYEYSVVAVPMNPLATADDVKASRSSGAKQKALIFQQLKAGNTLSNAYRSAGVGETMFWAWMKSDPDFNREVRASMLRGKQAFRADLRK